MITGALIFARNNEHIDYEAMARWSAKNVKRHLGIDTHIVTDTTRSDSGSRHFADTGTVAWHNTNRMDAYTESPWDRTLVLDADYVVASNQLLGILSCSEDFVAHRWAYDVTGTNDFEGLNWFGDVRMPMWWATVMVFNRCERARLIFETMVMIRDNWTHYKRIYHSSSRNYRNDHALTIALLIVNGHVTNHADVPWRLATLTPEHDLRQLDPDTYRVDFVDNQRQRKWLTLNQDFHAMGKTQLGDIVASHE